MGNQCAPVQWANRYGSLNKTKVSKKTKQNEYTPTRREELQERERERDSSKEWIIFYNYNLSNMFEYYNILTWIWFGECVFIQQISVNEEKNTEIVSFHYLTISLTLNIKLFSFYTICYFRNCTLQLSFCLCRTIMGIFLHSHKLSGEIQLLLLSQSCACPCLFFVMCTNKNANLFIHRLENVIACRCTENWGIWHPVEWQTDYHPAHLYIY